MNFFRFGSYCCSLICGLAGVLGCSNLYAQTVNQGQYVATPDNDMGYYFYIPEEDQYYYQPEAIPVPNPYQQYAPPADNDESYYYYYPQEELPSYQYLPTDNDQDYYVPYQPTQPNDQQAPPTTEDGLDNSDFNAYEFYYE